LPRVRASKFPPAASNDKTFRAIAWLLPCCALLVVALICGAGTTPGDTPYDTGPPFDLTSLEPVSPVSHPAGNETGLCEPRNPYNIFINYELGMHCVGFDISYCCIIPPYNSVQAQAVQSGLRGDRPRLLSPDDKIRLSYAIRDNTYSEGNKMKYWQVLKDVTGKGTMNDPGDNMVNYVWSHLFIYKDLAGTKPENPDPARRLHLGKEIPINVDAGPSGKPLSGGYMEYAGKKGGNIVFTDSMMPEMKDVPLTLTSSYLWDALGLPLTAFNDSKRKGSIRTITDRDFQPYQYAVVQMRDQNGKALVVKGKTVEFFGTEPVDISNCSACHSGSGKAATLSRGSGLSKVDREYAYWKKNYPDISEYVARLSATTINILELHDALKGTDFLREYNPDAASNRLGAVGSVNCVDCHGDNMSGNLQTPRPGATGYGTIKAGPLTEAVHSVHARLIPMPDKAGRTQNCQTCHPSHWQKEEMNDLNTNPHQVIDDNGNPRFSKTDLRTAGGGCYLRRDAHSNPYVKPPFFLNEIGKWYLREVSLKDEDGKPVESMRGLYCTNCHNHLSHELYRHDDLSDPVLQKGKTFRNRPIEEIIRTVAKGDQKRFKDFFADPIVGAQGDPLYTYYADHKGAVLLQKAGKKPVTYASASGGSDWWLSPSEPHCANCHAAPFVESGGGKYFPMDQPNKYAIFRYSKAHGNLACQSCHESVHGLYPVRYEGPSRTVDLASHEQALQFSPDGKYAGPVTCAACHTVNKKGVPVQLKGSDYYGDYWASVVLVHFMREGDQKIALPDLVKKYPYGASREIVIKGWK
jgi:mono/diheme cytochrome c family protein